MHVGGQDVKKGEGRMATARADRESQAESMSDWLSRTASQLRLGRILRVPVGYEDEAGFHCGEPRVEEILSDSEPPAYRRAEQF